MAYIFSNGNSFITERNGRFCQTMNLIEAYRFETEQDAINCFNHRIPKKDRIGMRLRLYSPPVSKFTAIKSDDVLIKSGDVTTLPYAKRKKCNQEVILPDNVNDWLTKLKPINDIIDGAKKREKVIGQEINQIDHEIGDLLHYIEFINLNARDGYKAYKRLHDARIHRRKLKNEQVIIQAILDRQYVADFGKDIERIINNIKDSEYAPRELKGLFS